MSDCVRYHRMKASELFMMIKLLYTPTEQAYFFQTIMQPRDNFRVFVCNNYDRVQSVAGLAALAGMSLSVFKRRFAEHFHDSVYHWMLQQKARKILADIRDGEDSTKALMDKYAATGDYLTMYYIDAFGVQALGEISAKARAYVETAAAGKGWGLGPSMQPGSSAGWGVEGQRDLFRTRDQRYGRGGFVYFLARQGQRDGGVVSECRRQYIYDRNGIHIAERKFAFVERRNAPFVRQDDACQYFPICIL